MTSSRTDPYEPTKEQSSSMEQPTMQETQRQTFCGCCSLRTGTLFCGAFCLVLSTMVIVTDATQYIQYPENYHLNKSILFKGVVGFIVSAFCVHGAVKENRYSLLPWLLAAAITITMFFLMAFYFILYGAYEIAMAGLTIMAASGLLTYWWFCVANYYTELRDRDETDCSPAPTRNYINPSAVTSPDAFTTPPPTYSVVVEGEKPPCYEEAKKIKEKAEKEQQQQGV